MYIINYADMKRINFMFLVFVSFCHLNTVFAADLIAPSGCHGTVGFSYSYDAANCCWIFTNTTGTDCGQWVCTWDFGDGSNPITETMGVSTSCHSFPGPGTYYVTLIVDGSICHGGSGNICTGTIPVTVPPLTTTSIVSDYNGYNVTCEGASDGWINMNSAAGYTYVWQTNPVQYGPNISGLTAGTYVVDLTFNGCAGSMSIILNEPIIQMNEVVSPTCFGLIDGDIVLSPSGGLNPYTYLWDTGDTTSSLSDLDTGVYSVQIFDAYGCVDSAAYVITESTQLSTQYTTSDYNGYQISCYGFNDGYIDLTISGSVPNYYTQWSSGQTSYDIYNLYAGVYTVNIIDDNGCKDSLEISIYEPPSILSNIVPTAIYNGYEISCNGYNDGFIDLSVSGAYPPYTYSWLASNGGSLGSNYPTAEDLDSLVAGTYTVTIIDTNNCPHVDNIVLDEPTVLFDNIISVYDYNTYDISCYNYNDGAIDLSVYGSVFPYFYEWNTLDVSQDLDSITEGWYFVDILDANNCFISDSIYLSHPTPIISSFTIPVMNGYNVTCNGGQDGSVDLTVSGSVPSYNFQWSNGYTSEDLASLGAGDYIYVVTDQNGCVTTDTLAIIEPILIIEDSVNHVSCSDGIDGAVFVNVSGSTAPYYVIWDNNINTSMLEDGVYSYQIIDSIGCTYNYNIIVNEPQPFVVVEQVVDVSCFAENDGSVSLNITGATPPYVIDWFGYATFNMIAGTYNFTIIDSNNCQYSEIAIINEPNPLDITYSISLPSCVDSYDGEIQLTVVGGTPTYNQNWLGFNPTSLGVGVFDVIVTDTNGCTENSSISLSPRSDMLIIEDVVNASCEGFCDGSADLAISNGILPYQSNWYGFNPDSLCPGVYFYEITDSLNCLYSDSILITSPDSIHLYITENSGVLYANTSGGVPPYSFSWFNIGNQLGNGETHTVTYIGDYYCVAYDNQHCQSDTAFYSNIILGINQSSVNGLLVYPNPTNGNLNVEFSTESNTEIEVGIIDVLGQYILLDSKNSSKGLYKEKIDLSLYARGVYLLNIRLNNNESINKKLILK